MRTDVNGRSIVFEFHDVSIENFREINLQLCKGEVCPPFWNLMIIPFASQISDNNKLCQEFSKQILAWKKHGHKLYLHGFKHKADLRLKRSLFGKLALFFTNGEAEFAGLARVDLEKTLDLAIAEWKKLDAGFPDGFVAPAWYGSRSLFIACKNRGFENYGSRFIMWNRVGGAKLSIPFSIAGLPKFIIPFVKKCECAYLKISKALPFLPIARIVKHPDDEIAD